MRNVNWILTYNHLDDKPMSIQTKMSKEKRQEMKKFSIPFKLFDDDGILYFSGKMTIGLYNAGEQIFNPLDYASAAWGCTELKVRGPRDQGVFTTV